MAFDKPIAVDVEDLGLQDNDGVLYVTVYGTTKEGTCSLGRWLGITPAWVPFQCKDMSEAGMACFLSTLYVVVDMVSTVFFDMAALMPCFKGRVAGTAQFISYSVHHVSDVNLYMDIHQKYILYMRMCLVRQELVV
jgi:hypothetical protein